MVLVRCFCPLAFCHDHCHFYLFQRQEGEEEGYCCAKRGKGSSAQEEIWYPLMEIAVPGASVILSASK